MKMHTGLAYGLATCMTVTNWTNSSIVMVIAAIFTTITAELQEDKEITAGGQACKVYVSMYTDLLMVVKGELMTPLTHNS